MIWLTSKIYKMQIFEWIFIFIDAQIFIYIRKSIYSNSNEKKLLIIAILFLNKCKKKKTIFYKSSVVLDGYRLFVANC